MSVRPTGRIGVYVHVPFCRRHCPYCDFAVVVSANAPHAAYRDALIRELDARAGEASGRTLQTIYFGGGTPSLWGVDLIGSVIAGVRDRIAGAPCEVTVEVNPEDVDPGLLDGLRRVGVDRISFGVQSFDARTLEMLGRHHTPERARRAVERAAEAGFARVSVDLVYAVPGAPPGRLDADLEVVESLAGVVDHVSAYELTFEPRTSFSARVARGRMLPLDEDEVVARSSRLVERLRAAGYSRYEVSNYAAPGGASIHNSSYWWGDEYLGLGVGAHSLALGPGARRRRNTRRLAAYLEGRFADEVEELSDALHLAELVMLGARTTAGIDFASVATRFGGGVTAPFRALADGWVRRGVGRWDGDRYVPEPVSIDIADAFGAEAIRLAESVGVC